MRHRVERLCLRNGARCRRCADATRPADYARAAFRRSRTSSSRAVACRSPVDPLLAACFAVEPGLLRVAASVTDGTPLPAAARKRGEDKGREDAQANEENVRPHDLLLCEGRTPRTMGQLQPHAHHPLGGNRCSNGRSTRCNMTGHSFAATIPPSATIAANKLQATSEREGGITGKADFTAAFPPRAQWTSWISMIPTTSG
jgi:hypothetical protein